MSRLSKAKIVATAILFAPFAWLFGQVAGYGVLLVISVMVYSHTRGQVFIPVDMYKIPSTQEHLAWAFGIVFYALAIFVAWQDGREHEKVHSQ